MSTEAMKLALEALEGIHRYGLDTLSGRVDGPDDREWQRAGVNEMTKRARLGITAIKEALAQPEQEPLEYWNAVEGWVKIDEVREHFESVSCGTIYKHEGEGRVPLYTTPPQRKPLTDEQIDAAIKAWFENEIVAGRQPFAKRMRAAIEAAHGIKENT